MALKLALVLVACATPPTFSHADPSPAPPVPAPMQRLGPVPEADPSLLPTVAAARASETGPGATSSVFIDVQDRDAVTALYRDELRDTTPAMNWTGSIGACAPGTVTKAFHDATLRRINFYRALAGVPPVEELASHDEAEPQAGALMMAAQQDFSHTPPRSWACWSEGGAIAANRSNLSLGTAGAAAMDFYVADYGSNNASVGHRRWLLYPPLLSMASGDVPGAPGRYATNALQVIGVREDPGASTRSPIIAWPTQGYVPRSLVPERWSVSLDGADFDGASVSALRDGVPVGTTVVSRDPGPGLNTLVWTLDETDAAQPGSIGDTVYTFGIGGVAVGGSERELMLESVTYDPDNPDPDEDDDGVAAGPAIGAAVPGTDRRYWYLDVESPLAQSFVIARSGTVERVVLPMYCESEAERVTLRLTTMGTVPGATLGSATWSGLGSGVAINGRRATFDFAGSVRLEAGTAYALVAESVGRCYWSTSEADYADGEGFFGSDDRFYSFAGDYPFEVVVLPDMLDNCPRTPNVDQLDADADGVGDGCDPEISLAPGRWHQLSLPAVPPVGESSVRAVLGDDVPGAYGVDWVVYGYDDGEGHYVDPGLDGELVAGRGYWLMHQGDGNVVLDLPATSTGVAYAPTARCAAPVRCYPVALATGPTVGWTMIGTASATPVDVNDLRVSTNAGPCGDIDACTVTEAGESGMMLDRFYHWDGARYASVGSGQAMDPWSGYWLSMRPGSAGQMRVSVR